MKFTPEKNDWIDIHSHLSADAPGVFRVYNLFLQDFQQEALPAVFSCGLHPWHIQQYSDIDNFPAQLEQSFNYQGMLAVGEAGLDKIIKTPMDLQKEVFATQVILSEKHQKPMIIHCVKAFPELLSVRNALEAMQPWIIHGFNNSLEMARELTKQGIYISTGMRLMKNAAKCTGVMKNIPLPYLFVETDEDETDIEEVYTGLANCKGISVEELKTSVLQNFNHIFK
jgi:TatD DNase family protein